MAGECFCIVRRRVKFERNAEFPAMEEQLHKEFRELRRRGIKVKGWWFKTRAKQILESANPNNTFKFSQGWFARFKNRYKISLRRPTNTAQKQPSEKEASIQEFHRQIREAQMSGMGHGDGPQEERFQLHQIANVDQTPLPFSFTQGPTYDTTNSSTVWVRGGSSGLDKRQCTAQLTIFADGKPRIKPFVIFRGKGKRISLRERLQYDKRVTVHFQTNAWCDEVAMEQWVKNCWKPCVKEESLLILDIHNAQKTDHIKDLLKECDTTPIFVPAGCTSIIQPLDVCYNAPFKSRVEGAAMQHMQDNLEGYLNGKFTAGERRVLLTKWVGQAWEELSENKEMTVTSFKKCGISTAADGSEDFEIHLEGLEDYEVKMNDPSTDDDGDPFVDLIEGDADIDEASVDHRSNSDIESDPFAHLSDDDSLTEED